MIINGKHGDNPKNRDYIQEKYDKDLSGEIRKNIINGGKYNNPELKIQRIIDGKRYEYREFKRAKSELNSKIDDREEINNMLHDIEASELIDSARESRDEF